MKLNPIIVYLWLELDAIQTVCTVTALFCGFLLTFCLIGIGIEDDTKVRERLTKYARRLALATVLSVFISTALPTTKEMATIYILPKITNSKTFHKILDSGDKATNLLLDYVLQELQTKLNSKKELKNKKSNKP